MNRQAKADDLLDGAVPHDPPMGGRYALVLIIEVVVLLGLWYFSWHFS